MILHMQNLNACKKNKNGNIVDIVIFPVGIISNLKGQVVNIESISCGRT